jgi:hypothetical protein
MENPAMNGAKWRVPQVPPGSSQVVACVKRSEKMNRFSIVGTLNSGGPESEAEDAGRHPMADCDQPQEDAIWTLRESDPPIVVRDGSAGYTPTPRLRRAGRAKEWAGRQRKQSTHCGTRLLPAKVSSSLLASGIDSGTLCPGRFHVRVFLRSPVR